MDVALPDRPTEQMFKRVEFFLNGCDRNEHQTFGDVVFHFSAQNARQRFTPEGGLKVLLDDSATAVVTFRHQACLLMPKILRNDLRECLFRFGYYPQNPLPFGFFLALGANLPCELNCGRVNSLLTSASVSVDVGNTKLSFVD